MTRERDGEDDVTRRFSMVAHELPDPLTVAQGDANLRLGETAEGDETVRRLAERISHDVELATLRFEGGADGRGTNGPPGLGVGLHRSRLIAEAHDGSLRVEPVGVQGSRFALELPVASG
jgi:signal transduction histidine kinase